MALPPMHPTVGANKVGLLRIPLGLPLLLFMGVAMSQTYYKWIDASGVTHYGQEAPAHGKTSKLDLHNGATAVTVKRELPQVDSAAADEAEKQYNLQSCASAKNDLKLLASNALLVAGGSAASPVDVEQAHKLTPEQREAARTEATKRIHEYCENE